MKLKQMDADFDSALNAVLDGAEYTQEEVERNYSDSFQTETRMLWDFLHASDNKTGRRLALIAYSLGANDSHITTALRAAWDRRKRGAK